MRRGSAGWMGHEAPPGNGVGFRGFGPRAHRLLAPLPATFRHGPNPIPTLRVLWNFETVHVHHPLLQTSLRPRIPGVCVLAVAHVNVHGRAQQPAAPRSEGSRLSAPSCEHGEHQHEEQGPQARFTSSRTSRNLRSRTLRRDALRGAVGPSHHTGPQRFQCGLRLGEGSSAA